MEILSPRFLGDDLALEYTKVEFGPNGSERLAWAMPTEEFRLRQEVDVKSRVLGSELRQYGLHETLYPIGTKLKDIEFDEPTIGCPGNQLAYAMWDRTIDVMVGERLWEQER